ncbi:hypothetical protein MTR67_045880 [Solanum verrucosum]|uniref:DUF7138 domain-containing protein n=1 Tax=Solanum verrucosum TaxID=315347 RepID=A0AAF0UTI8_SOLVR|nr:hypothetical protein MTR67_045880 [Solanum verrucosum]
MVEGGKGSVFPVIFFDGEREMNIGNIIIQPTLVFKPFQLMISERIGISPNQISIYLCDRKGYNNRFEDRRKMPVTGKANFAVISREKNCFFLVVMKRSRKARNRKVKSNSMEFGEFLEETVFSHLSSSENLILLRRNQTEMNQLYDRITQMELTSMNERVQNLQLQRETFDLVMQNPNPNPNLMHLNNPSSFPRIQDTFPTKKSLCYECANTSSNGETSTFHHCNNDAVLVGSFRSRSGPINRPAKQSL